MQADGPITKGQAPSVSPSSGATNHVAVLLDGWSYRILSTANLTASTSGNPSAPVSFRPASAADFAELARTTPGLLTQVMARMVTVDPKLACTAAGCSDSSGALPVSLLSNPSSIPVLGAEYAGYKITSGLYIATLDTGADGSDVTLSADGYQPLTFPGLPFAPLNAQGQKRTPDAANGYLAGRYLVAAGLGRLFAPDAAWLGSNPAQPARIDQAKPQGVSDPAASAGVALQNPALVGTGGLTAPLPLAQTWNESHLTYATSPAAGCGWEAVCVPAALPPTTVSHDGRTVSKVCSPDGKLTAVGVSQDVTVSLVLPAPTYQNGVGLQDVSWMTPPTLQAAGPQTFTFNAVGLLDGSPMAERLIAGRANAGPYADLGLRKALPVMTTDGFAWQTC